MEPRLGQGALAKSQLTPRNSVVGLLAAKKQKLCLQQSKRSVKDAGKPLHWPSVTSDVAETAASSKHPPKMSTTGKDAISRYVPSFRSPRSAVANETPHD